MKKFFICSIIFAVCCAGGENLRVVSLSPALTELLFHLGRGDTLVGRSDACDYPARVKKLPVAGRFAGPYLEQITALKPRLVLCNDLINPGVMQELQNSGIRTLRLPCRNISEYLECVKILGRELGVEKAAAAETDRVKKLLSVPVKPTGLKILWVVWDTPLLTPGKKSHLNEIITLAGAVNITGKNSKEYLRPSVETLLLEKPDGIVWNSNNSSWRKRSPWRQFPAVKAGQTVHEADFDALLRPGPRMFDGIETLRRIFAGWKKL